MASDGDEVAAAASLQGNKWQWRVGEAAVLALAAFLRFYRIDASSLWSDEGNTWAMIQRSAGEISVHAAADIHPPGYYWMLKGWSLLFGTDAASMRSFSALCGVLLVWAIARIAGEIVRDHPSRRWLPLLAAFVAAVNPFQIYYSQEARMYMLLALASALLMWGLLRLLRAESSANASWTTTAPALLLYGAAAMTGLWTHYSFPIVLLAAGIAWLVWWLRAGHTAAPLLRFAMVNLVALALFAPWLPTAIRQLTTWPAGGASLPLLAGLEMTLRTLLLGLMHTMPNPAWLWLALAAILPFVGAIALRRSRTLPTLLLWMLLPIGMMAAFGLFTDAFLKFLLVASAPWCILVAASPEIAQKNVAPWLRTAVALGAAIFALLALPPYWQDANARDNYAGVARHLAATANPATDMVLLNGPGQADVWRYYDSTFPVLPIPDSRPADPARIEEQLADWTSGRRAVHALIWATEQSDPESIVTTWLDTHLFKGRESWQNNVRYAQYFVDEARACEPLQLQGTTPEGAAVLSLESLCLTTDALPEVMAGEPYMVQFEWLADAPLEERYKVSVQIIEGDSTVIAQHDGEPAGGSMPTTDWQTGEVVQDRHAVLIPIGTIPGDKSVRVIVYDAESGEPLRFGNEPYIQRSMRVTLPTSNPPIEMLPMDAIVNQRMDGVTLLGYTQYKKDFGHAPETPLQTGDTLRLALFWQAPNPLPEGWQPNQQVTISLGDATITTPLAGVDYPTEMWQPGQIVRGDFDVPVDSPANRVRVVVGDDAVRLRPLP
jgi:hypothetical protein